MSKELLKHARAAVQIAKNKGAQGVRANVYREKKSSVEWRDGKLDRLRQATEMGLSVTLFVDSRYSANSTSDLRPEAVERFIGETVAATRFLATDPHRRLPDPKRYTNRFTGDLQLFDQAGASAVTAVSRRQKAQQLEQAARSAPGADKIISVTGNCSDTILESAKVTSNGMEGTRQRSRFTLGAETTVKGEGDKKPEGWWYVSACQRNKLPSIESIGSEATRRARMYIGAKKEKSGEYRCIIENVVVGRLLRGLLSPLNGNAIQQQRSVLHDKLGEQITNPVLSITDDPLLVQGLSSRTFDGEGMSTVKRHIIDKGVLRTFFLDTYYASKLKKTATTRSRSNLVFSTGKKNLQQLIETMDRGILVTSFLGGNSNDATGDFSIGVRGMWVEKGKLVRPLSEMNLAGNHLTFWKKLLETGNDPYFYSSTRSPSLLFDKVQFSGI